MRTKVLFTAACCALLTLSSAYSHTGSDQCRNGIDDDGDGKIDALIELRPDNGEVYTLAGPNGIGNPELVRATVARLITQKKLPLTVPWRQAGSALLRSTNAYWPPFGGPDTGTEELVTLTEVCNILGYRDYISSTCRDSERSHHYPQGKCNYHSPGNNSLWRYINSNFAIENATPKYGKTWIATITCRNRLAACSDGWDNDGDGKTDRQDPDCLSDNDTSELPKDPKCKNPNYPTEFEQCRNRIDDDGDMLIDAQDPGCWRKQGVPSSYDPQIDYEARNNRVPQCRDGIDNDRDGAIDSADFSCSHPDDTDESSPRAQCQDGIDNDHDGLIDLADRGCSSAQDNSESGPCSKSRVGAKHC